MKLMFDPNRDLSNQQKYGVSLAQAEHFEWKLFWALPDTCKDNGETRWIGYAPIGNRVYCVVYTDRGDSRRIVSLRKANQREVKHYASHV